jgi:hypothetical protein
VLGERGEPVFDVLVLLSAGVGGIDALRAYERRVVPILYEYRGELLTAFAPRLQDQGSGPDEIHVLRFESEGDFIAFQEDSRIAMLASERESAIASTLVYVGDEFVAYETAGRPT